MADNIADAIEENALGPASATVDGTSATQHRLPDLIEADRYQKAKTGAAKNHLGLRFRKLEPGGGGL